MAIYKLKDICLKIGSGATPRGGKEAYCDEGISLIRSQNVLDFTFSYDGLAHINDQQAEKLSNVEVKPQDILLNITGDSVARVCTVDPRALPARVNQHVAIIRPDENRVLSSYILYFLQMIKPYLLQIAAGGATRNALTKSMIENLELEVPDILSQKKIVSVLDDIQEKIRDNNEINKNLYEQMLSIFNNARRTSAWSKHKLGEVLIFFDNLRKPLSSIQREKMAHIYPYYGAASIVDYVEDYLFDGTYILISEDGANVIDSFGHPLTQYTYGKFWVNNHAHIVKGSNGYSGALVYAMLGTLNMQSIVTGAAQPKINQANLRNFEAVLPESEEAQVLSELLNPMLQQMLHHDQENEKLSELRDILLPQLMSGALDVSAIDL